MVDSHVTKLITPLQVSHWKRKYQININWNYVVCFYILNYKAQSLFIFHLHANAYEYIISCFGTKILKWSNLRLFIYYSGLFLLKMFQNRQDRLKHKLNIHVIIYVYCLYTQQTFQLPSLVPLEVLLVLTKKRKSRKETWVLITTLFLLNYYMSSYKV